MSFIPHTDADTKSMLQTIGIENLDQLFKEIPQSLLFKDDLKIPDQLSEMELMVHANDLAANNKNGICFIGAGSYDHYIPAAVWDIASRGEFLTAYTPYQAEASQGTLQLLYEFQTMIAQLTGMDAANASLYDGATALAESVLMAIRINKHAARRVLMPLTLHPFYQQTLKTILHFQGIELITLPYNLESGITDIDNLSQYSDENIAALIIPFPNFFGCLEQVDILTNWAFENKIISIACVNPTAVALLKEPGSWGKHGVDIVCGEGQPLGIPIASGGPYFGFLSTKLAFVRQLPGRLVGRTNDREGKVGYTLTLQAREQHIRRAKATSNICTNQGLMVTAATIYMALMGPGLRNIAMLCHENTRYLINKLAAIGPKKLFPTTPFFHEFVIVFDASATKINQGLAQEGIAAGLPLEPYYPELKNALLVCATEKRSKTDIDSYINAISRHQ